jgi:hypothetical protein
MHIVFVNPPSVSLDTNDLAPPLWALVLGAVVREIGCRAELLDCNLEMLAQQAPTEPSAFVDWAAQRICSTTPDLVCYSSMGVNSHVVLDVASRIREIDPSICQVVGGPHFSSIAREIIAHFSCIDGVFFGEAERSLRYFIESARITNDWHSVKVPGVLTRHNSATTFGDRLQVHSEHIPAPAYELVELARYFTINPRRLMNFEAGRRGCIYACRFCYAPSHFGRGERLPSDMRFVREMQETAALGARHLFIVTDNFLNYPAKTSRLCRLISEAGRTPSFNCYATLGQLNDSVIRELSRAGCRSIYVGVDAVHPEARREFAKGMFRSQDDLCRKVDLCLSNAITPTLAFLLEEPEKNRENFEATVATAAAVAMRGCPVALNTLTIYPGTPLAQKQNWVFTPTDLKVRIAFDAPEVVCKNRYAENFPGLFPFHSTHRDIKAHGELLQTAHALKTLLSCAPDYLSSIAEAGKSADFVRSLLTVTPSEFAQWDPYRRRKEPIHKLISVYGRRNPYETRL